MPVRRGIPCVVALLALAGACHDKKQADKHAAVASAPAGNAECASVADCPRGDLCSKASCVAGRCVASLLPAGSSCDNANVCDGVARCDENGVCRPGPPPAVDDGNACTTDACDPVTGVTHTPVDVDDHDACTTDACDPASGPTHTPVDTDDGDDCTFDSCDPATGVTHKKPDSVYTCDASCGAGFHAVSRAPSAQCGGAGALQTFCAPDCGASFYSCGTHCPARYHAGSRRPATNCGGDASLYTFCQKDDANGFYTCDACPAGFRQAGQTPTTQCGPDTTSMARCVAGS